VTDLGVRPGEDESLVPGVGPPHEERRAPFGSVDLEDLSLAHRLTHMSAVHHELVTYGGVHDASLTNRGPFLPPS
jgi:hypothetical protein